MGADTTHESSGRNLRVGSLQSIASGASVSLVGRVFMLGMGFVFNLALTRAIGISAYGLYAYGNTIVDTLLSFANLGSNKAVLRYMAEYDDSPRKQQQILGVSYLTSIGGGVGLVTVLMGSAPYINAYTLNDPRFTPILRAFALLLLIKTLLKLTSDVFRGLELIHYEVLLDKILAPIVRVGLVGLALLVGFSLLKILGALIVGSAAVLTLSVVVLVSYVGLAPSLNGIGGIAREYYAYVLPLSLQGVGLLLFQRVDIFMIGYFFDSSSVGIYNIAMLLASVLAFPLGAFNQLAPAVISKLYYNGNIEELESVYGTITRWTLTVSLLLAVGIVSYRTEILTLFGPAFAAGGTVLVLFALGQVVNASVGPSGYVLMMTGHQYLTSANIAVGGVVNVVLNYYFIQEFGVIGAAFGTALTLGLVNVARVIEVWYFEELVPYSRAFSKPIVAAAGAAAVMSVWPELLSGMPLLFIGGPSGSIAFVVLLLLLGIEDEDKEFAADVYDNIS